jgi:hypothetical protein
MSLIGEGQTMIEPLELKEYARRYESENLKFRRFLKNRADPDECRGYPYTDKPDRIWSLFGVIEFVETCPVVFEIVQRLKEIYGFRSRVRS